MSPTPSAAKPATATRSMPVAPQPRRTPKSPGAKPIAEVVASAAEPFVQAVYGIDVPRMAQGRVCLIGDAAFAVRPHAVAGTAKAAASKEAKSSAKKSAKTSKGAKRAPVKKPKQ